MRRGQFKPIAKYVSRRVVADYDAGMTMVDMIAKHKLSFPTIKRIVRLHDRPDREKRTEVKKESLQQTLELAEDLFTVKKSHIIKGAQIDRYHSKVKQIVCWVLKTHFQYSLKSIGDNMNYKDHTTVLYAVDRVSKTKALKLQALRLQLELQNREAQNKKRA